MRPFNLLDILPESLSFLTGFIHPFFLLGMFAFFLSLWTILVFKKLGNRRTIEEIKKKIRILLIEMRLHQGDLKEIFRIQNRIILLNLRYIRASLIFTLPIIIPMMFCLISFKGYFAYKPIGSGEIFTLKIVMKADTVINPVLDKKSLPTSIHFIEEDPLLNRWVFRAGEAGRYTIAFKYKDVRFTKQVVVGKGLQKISPENTTKRRFDVFYNAGETRLPSSLKGSIEKVVLHYEPMLSGVALFGWRPGWFSFFMLVFSLFVLVNAKIFPKSRDSEI